LKKRVFKDHKKEDPNYTPLLKELEELFNNKCKENKIKFEYKIKLHFSQIK
jgi:hypothetical protein